MTDEEILTHTIVLDDYIKIEWKIPKVITPLQLKAMSSKINRLFNLSEVQIVSEPSGDKQVETTEPVQDLERAEVMSKWTPELKTKVKKLYLKGLKPMAIAKEMYAFTKDEYFRPVNVIYQQLNYLKKVKFCPTKRELKSQKQVEVAQ